MNNNLIPEQRPDSNGKVTTRWVRANVHGSSQKVFAPAPTTGTPPEKSEHSRSLFEKVLDSLVNLLLGPEDPKEAAAEAEARDLLRQRLSELPERTVRNLGDAWEKAKKWADEGLDSTEFGRFSERVREQVADLLRADEHRETMHDQFPAETAARVDDYADRIRRSTEAREAQAATRPETSTETAEAEDSQRKVVPPVPEHEPSIHYWQDDEEQELDEAFSPLNEFFEDVDYGTDRTYNSNIDDLMDNGRTRRHH